ncbi:MAG TPA: 3-hydroxyacyl-ACP dehydratase FabZ [Burkholderiaceae bacterium]|jgi:3-hydroxyacyl-[acyl-carrier-protein] dehydratase|nr:3-hydroxyacyl-ACP dehydratase FabZ [Burkholderiaceae bacterium]HPE01644.1 3-hydroxyacyl-ACP dehydratase FabZ [Burkholderiaceae bacterium]HRZ01372.1 3-hydroxyacyl-ACP dehydratase FabZ [Burkholderiaceae bacterium]
MTMDINQIMRLLPHRYPFLLVDRVLEIEPGKRIVALKNVTANEPHFTGHFPHLPVMPGVMIIEAMAQAAAIFSFLSLGVKADPDSLFYFAGIDSARFKRPVVPGDQLRMEVEFLREKAGIGKFHGRATVDGQLACEAEMMCAYRRVARAPEVA